MAASVGGKLEVVQRPRSLFGPDYLRLTVLVILSLFVHGWLIATTAMTARDSLGFARQALCFENPSASPPHPDGRPKNTLDHIREYEHPPGFPLAVWGVDVALRQVSNRSVAERALLATQLANAIAAVLLVIPTYLLGRLLFSRNVGFAAAALFQVLPVPARITSDGLTEGLYLLAAATAILLGVRAIRQPRISGFLLCGIATGASYLVRPEGLLIAGAAGAVIVWYGISRAWSRDAAFARLTALTIGVALVAVPYIALIGKLSNKPTSDYLDPTQGPSGPIYRSGPESKINVHSDALFAAWWNHEVNNNESRELWAAAAVFKEMSKGSNYVVWPLALFALAALRRRIAAEPGHSLLLVMIGLNLALLIYLAARVGYVSERHTLLLTLIGCQFAAAGLPQLAAAMGQVFPFFERFGVRISAAGLLVALIAASLPFAMKPLHAHREGHKHAGMWLAEHLRNDDALVDPFCWGEWYAGRTLYRTSWNPNPSRNTYVIWENKSKSPHSRLPTFGEAKSILAAPDARIVYHWPENVPASEAEVQVWKIGPE